MSFVRKENNYIPISFTTKWRYLSFRTLLVTKFNDMPQRKKSIQVSVSLFCNRQYSSKLKEGWPFRTALHANNSTDAGFTTVPVILSRDKDSKTSSALHTNVQPFLRASCTSTNEYNGFNKQYKTVNKCDY